MFTRPLIPNANISNWIPKASLGSTTTAANKDMGVTRITGVHFSQQCYISGYWLMCITAIPIHKQEGDHIYFGGTRYLLTFGGSYHWMGSQYIQNSLDSTVIAEFMAASAWRNGSRTTGQPDVKWLFPGKLVQFFGLSTICVSSWSLHVLLGKSGRMST